MNREDIICMAREVGFSEDEIDNCQLMFEHFANLVCQLERERIAALVAFTERERLTDAAMKAAEKSVDVAIALEREACAKVAESIAKDMTDLAQWGATQCANSIRKRGQA